MLARHIPLYAPPVIATPRESRIAANSTFTTGYVVGIPRSVDIRHIVAGLRCYTGFVIEDYNTISLRARGGIVVINRMVTEHGHYVIMVAG